jgi:WD40 repeat protein
MSFTLKGHTGDVYGLAFSPDRQQLASASADGTVKMWEALYSKRTNCASVGPVDIATTDQGKLQKLSRP